MNSHEVQEGLKEVIRTTEHARNSLSPINVDDLVKLNKSLRKLYRDLWRHQADDMFYKMDQLEEELRKEREKNEQLTRKNE